jgi:hypothetical protein
MLALRSIEIEAEEDDPRAELIQRLQGIWAGTRRQKPTASQSSRATPPLCRVWIPTGGRVSCCRMSVWKGRAVDG